MSDASESRALDSSPRIVCFAIHMHSVRHAGKSLDAGLPQTNNSERRSELLYSYQKHIVFKGAGKDLNVGRPPQTILSGASESRALDSDPPPRFKRKMLYLYLCMCIYICSTCALLEMLFGVFTPNRHTKQYIHQTYT